MDMANLAIAVVVAAVLTMGLLLGMFATRKAAVGAQKYPLYEARDNLLRKIVTGQLDRSNPQVLFLYDLVNHLINDLKPFTLFQFLSMFSIRDHNSPIASKLAEIAQSDNKHLAEAARDVIGAAVRVLMAKSVALKLGLYLAHIRLMGFRFGFSCALRLKNVLAHVSATHGRALDLYWQLNRARGG